MLYLCQNCTIQQNCGGGCPSLHKEKIPIPPTGSSQDCSWTNHHKMEQIKTVNCHGMDGYRANSWIHIKQTSLQNDALENA